jgi:hypothetical protein
MKTLLASLLALCLLALTPIEAQSAPAVPTPTKVVTVTTTPAGVSTTTTIYRFSGVTSANLAATITAATAETPSEGGAFVSLSKQASGSTYTVISFYR